MKTIRNDRFMLLFLVVLAAMLKNFPLYGQDTSSVTKEHHYWVNAGLGLGFFRQSDGTIGGLFGGISLSYRIRNRIISLRYVKIKELDLSILIPVPFGSAGGGSPPPESVSEFGALFGINIKDPYGLVALSGGISFVRVVRYERLLISHEGWSEEKYKELTSHTFGIPIEIQLFWTPFSFLGIGIYGAGNLNSQRSFAAGLVCLQLGKLR